jgi:hypothetical protein
VCKGWRIENDIENMKKAILIIFSFVMLASALAVLSACSVKLPSEKQAPQAVKEIPQENPATKTAKNNTASSSESYPPPVDNCTTTEKLMLTAENIKLCGMGYIWSECEQKCLVNKTWKLRDDRIFEDKDGVYIYDDGNWQILDKKTFTKLSAGYFKDKNKVVIQLFFGGASMARNVNQADAKTFEVMKQYSYAKDKNNIYNRGGIISGVDRNSFEILDKAYSKDKNNVYFTQIGGETVKIKNADAGTFKIEDSNGEWSEMDIAVSMDKNNVYCRGQKVDGADLGTFHQLSPDEYNNFAKEHPKSVSPNFSDKNHFYDFECNIVK